MAVFRTLESTPSDRKKNPALKAGFFAMAMANFLLFRCFLNLYQTPDCSHRVVFAIAKILILKQITMVFYEVPDVRKLFLLLQRY